MLWGLGLEVWHTYTLALAATDRKGDLRWQISHEICRDV